MKVYPQYITSLDDSKYGPRISVYPNPATESSAIDVRNVSGLPTTIIILDFNGRVVRQFVSGEKNIHLDIDLSDFASGLYIIKASNTMFDETRKMTVNH